MHLSFSLAATDSGSTAPVGSQVIHLFLQSVGVTLTEVQDIVFRYTKNAVPIYCDNKEMVYFCLALILSLQNNVAGESPL